MKNLNEIHAVSLRHENLDEQDDRVVPGTVLTQTRPLVSAEWPDATNENSFADISACSVRLGGGDLAAFWKCLS